MSNVKGLARDASRSTGSAACAIEDARPPHFLRLVKELRAKTREVDGDRLLSEKSIANVLGTLRTMFGEAHFNEVIVGNPCVLPRKTLKRRSKARAPYSGREVLALLSDKVDVTRRVFVWLAFYTGMREGEICGRRSVFYVYSVHGNQPM